MPDREVAHNLARALDGERTGIEEADSLALLLRDAAGRARFEVTGEETERALARIARRRRPASRRNRRRPLLAAVIAAAAAAMIGFFVFPESHAPGVDVGGRALAAINTPGPVQQTVLRVSRPGGGDQVVRTEWVDLASGRIRVQVEVNGRVASQMLQEPDGRVVSYQEGARRAVLAASCRSIAGGCSELVDPVDFYRSALTAAGTGTVQNVTAGGKPGYRFMLPVQRGGPGVTGVEQVVTVDASTFLPRRIVWRERPAGGAVHTVAVLDVVSITDIPEADEVGAFTLAIPGDVPLVQLDGAGAELEAPTERAITLAQARNRFPHAYWLGRRFRSHRLSSVSELRWRSGTALRLRYGPLTLWSFDRVIPPDLLEGRVLPVKLLSQSGVTERFYRTASGRLAAERDLPSGSLAAVAPSLDKLDLFEALSRARPL
jgi:hypothetical protein